MYGILRCVCVCVQQLMMSVPKVFTFPAVLLANAIFFLFFISWLFVDVLKPNVGVFHLSSKQGTFVVNYAPFLHVYDYESGFYFDVGWLAMWLRAVESGQTQWANPS